MINSRKNLTLSLCRLVALSLLVTCMAISACTPEKSDRTPIQIAKAVADKVIRESEFSFKLESQGTVQGIELIDFRQSLPYKEGSVAYAYSFIKSHKDTTILFGLSSAGKTSLWLNDAKIAIIKGMTPSQPFEESYNRFVFQKYLKIRLKKGENKILIKTSASDKEWAFFLRPVDEVGDPEPNLKFSLSPLDITDASSSWLAMGPFDQGYETIYEPERGFKPGYEEDNKIYHWFYPKQNTLMTLNIPESNSYKRDSYLDWHYANGATMWSILAIFDQTGDKTYSEFVRNYSDFVVDNYYYFKWQYNYLHAFRGSFHRIFRRSMLDDTGAPVLPLVQLYLNEKDDRYVDLIYNMSKYVFNEQARLDDGTLCRPEPVRWTVWADDLFMSIPLLIRMSKITGEDKYINDAIKQIKQFYGLLFDSEKSLCYHGWFSPDQKTSVSFWGRANGWMIWALSEALLYVPDTNPEYKAILEIFKAHVSGLIRYQGKSGMWHQVLDQPESFEETSCTAMYIIAIARGVRNGWLDQEYQKNTIKAWQALKKNIDQDGTVHDICRGTGIGYDPEFYYNRQRFDHDPRGLGAVITAALEIDKIIN